MSDGKHQLVGGTLRRTDNGIVARCQCGWSSVHFTSLAASAAFMDHQETTALSTTDHEPREREG